MVGTAIRGFPPNISVSDPPIDVSCPECGAPASVVMSFWNARKKPSPRGVLDQTGTSPELVPKRPWNGEGHPMMGEAKMVYDCRTINSCTEEHHLRNMMIRNKSNPNCKSKALIRWSVRPDPVNPVDWHLLPSLFRRSEKSLMISVHSTSSSRVLVLDEIDDFHSAGFRFPVRSGSGITRSRNSGRARPGYDLVIRNNT